MQSGDIYCCDWNYTTNAWGTPYKKVGTDGAPGHNGSDANVSFNSILKSLQRAEATETSFITADAVGSPTIYGAKIYGAEIYAGGINKKGGQVVELTDSGIGILNGHGNRVLAIHAYNGDAWLTTGYNILRISAPSMDLSGIGNINFTGVETTGLNMTLA